MNLSNYTTVYDFYNEQWDESNAIFELLYLLHKLDVAVKEVRIDHNYVGDVSIFVNCSFRP